MHRLAAPLLVAVAGCGRLSFDSIASSRDGGGDAIADVSPDALDLIHPYVVAPDPFSTTSASFVTIPDAMLTVPASPGQQWLLLVNGTLVSSSLADTGAEAQYLVNGIVRGAGGTESVDVTRPGPWQHFYVFEGGTTETSITFQIRDTQGATTTLDHLRAFAVPIPATAEAKYVANDGPIDVTSGTLADLVQLSPDTSAGEYLVLLLYNASEAPGSSDIDTVWLDPSGTMQWSPSFQNPRQANQSHLIARVAMLTGPTSFRLQAASGGPMSTVSYVRVFALRVAGLPGFAAKYDQTTAPTTMIGETVVNTLVPPPSSVPGPYLTLGTLRVDDDCANAMLAARGVRFEVNGTPLVAGQHLSGNCAAELTYGFIGLGENRPNQIRASINSGNGQNVIYRESTLFTFAVP